MFILYISQVIPVHVTIESALSMIVGVMAMMTVEITVMKKNVGDGRWGETRCFAHIFGLFKNHIYLSCVLARHELCYTITITDTITFEQTS